MLTKAALLEPAAGDELVACVRAEQPALDVLVDDAELLARREGWVVPTPRYPKGFLAKYAKLAQGAELGAITR